MLNDSKRKKIRFKTILLVLAPVLLAMIIIAPMSTWAQKKEKKALLIVVSSVTIEDLTNTNTPNLDSLQRHGAIGLMNARAANIKWPGSFYLSIGAGTRAEAGSLGGLGFNVFEILPRDLFKEKISAKEVYLQNNKASLEDENIANLGINNATARSFKYRNNVVPGLLGEALKVGGKKTAALGNADTLQEKHREITLVTMNLKGKTDFGLVSSATSTEDKSFPGGIRTDYEELAKQTTSLLDKADFLAVDLGDSARVDYQRLYMNDFVNQEKRREALIKADKYVGEVMKKLKSKNILTIVTAPKPQSDSMKARDYLTPVIVSGLGKGALSSDTTRRSGVIANIDIAPTILKHFGLTVPPEAAGNQIKAEPLKNTVDFVKKRHSQIFVMRTFRTPIIIIYSILLLIGLIFGLAHFWMRRSGRRVSKRATSSLRFFLLFLLAVPFSSLLQIPLDANNVAISFTSAIVIALGVAAVAVLLFRKQSLGPILFVVGATTALIIVDTMTGSNLSQRSFLGSDIISGGRYYGLGNVYMGVLIGASLFSVASLFDIKLVKNNKAMPYIGFIALILVGFVIGHPSLGANIGGLITATATAIIFAQVLMEKKFSWKTALTSIVVLAFAVTLLLGIDFVRKEATQSHAGKAISVIQVKGATAISDIIARKVKQNRRGTFSFTGFILMGMVIIALFMNQTVKKDEEISKEFDTHFPTIKKAFFTMAWAALIGFLFNDTGAVTASAIATYLLVPLLYISLTVPKTQKA